MAFKFGNKINRDGLVFYLDAANYKSYTSGSSNWNDISKNGIRCSMINTPGFDSGSGGSIVFDGSSTYATGGDLNTGLMKLNTDVTLETCVYINGAQTDTAGIFNYGDPIPNYGVCIVTPDNIQYNVGILVGGNVYRSSIAFSLNSWNHVCVTLGNDKSIYINGIFIQSHTYNPTLSSSNTINIGLYTGLFSANAKLNGKISIVRVYNRILSATEVFQNFNATRTRFNL